jgi:two-component system NtrC family sensor kinase
VDRIRDPAARRLSVARPRRLRHKLLLGLGLVVASVALLLGGTLYGIRAYLSTVHTTERKLEELRYITVVINTLAEIDRADPTNVSAEYKHIRNQTMLAKGFVDPYRLMIADTVALGLDPDDGKMETDLTNDLDASLGQLLAALESARTGSDIVETKSLRSHPAVKAAYDQARLKADQLRFALGDDIRSSAERSNKVIRQSLWTVGAAVVAAIVLVLALVYYFKKWIFTPIKALQRGVQRVDRGDFDHPIQISSQDELEELANSFNGMASRVAATYADLARQVNERSRQLVRSERMVSVGFLAAGVAREINNPLASIAFCGEALERRLQDVLAVAMNRTGKLAPDDAEVLTRYLKMIQQEAFRCKEITTKLLDFSRTGEKKREQTDIAGLIRSVLEIACHLPNCRGKEILFNPEGYVVAAVNAQDLKSVILNLVVNALDSMDETGKLSITLTAHDGLADLSFTDSGCGMPAEVLENIFEPFFTRNRTGKGTGLGLFISHQIIDQHGGTLQATSPGPGQGSTFTVRVPLEAKEDRSESKQEPNPGILVFPGSKAAAAAA